MPEAKGPWTKVKREERGHRNTLVGLNAGGAKLFSKDYISAFS